MPLFSHHVFSFLFKEMGCFLPEVVQYIMVNDKPNFFHNQPLTFFFSCIVSSLQLSLLFFLISVNLWDIYPSITLLGLITLLNLSPVKKQFISIFVHSKIYSMVKDYYLLLCLSPLEEIGRSTLPQPMAQTLRSFLHSYPFLLTFSWDSHGILVRGWEWRQRGPQFKPGLVHHQE